MTTMDTTSNLLQGETSNKEENHEGTDIKLDEFELRVVLNAEALLRTSCTINQLADLLAGKEGPLNKDALLKALINSTVDKTIIPFSAVTHTHTKALGMDVVSPLKFNSAAETQAQNSQSPANLALSRVATDSVKDHFSISYGSRCLIDQYLLAAVLYAQDILNNDSVLKNNVKAVSKVDDPHVAVFTELQIPPTKITSGEKSYTFHGSWDYAMGIIEAMDKPSLRRGTLKLSASHILSGIAAVKSLAEMEDAVPQLIARISTVFSVTEKETFTGILSNGMYWRIFVARSSPNHQLQILRSRELDATDDSGIIVELLKDAILYSISPIIETLA